MLEWKFSAQHAGKLLHLWGFYLEKGGKLYDEGMGAFVGAPRRGIGDYQNEYLGEVFVTAIYPALMDSEIFQT
jgi:hypothetical protein